MVASPNGLRFVYDGDNSNGGGYPAPDGSALIEDLFTDFLDAEGWTGTRLHLTVARTMGHSFGQNPAGGLFTGAEGLSAENGQTLDPCYHQFCDTTENLDASLFLDMARTAAHVTDTVADLKSGQPNDSVSIAARSWYGAPRAPRQRGHGGCGRTHR